MKSLFNVCDELKKLDEKEAVALFGQLLRHEASSVGISITAISCPRNTKESDGGIDASIISRSNRSDLIIDDYVAYQIKAVNDYKPWNKSTILNELFSVTSKEAKNINLLKDKKSLNEETFDSLSNDEKKSILKPAIKKCFDDNGTYVCVSFKSSAVEKNTNMFEKNIKEFLTACGYENPKFKLWGYENLNNVIETKYPFIALKIKDITKTKGIYTLENIKNTSDLKNKYVFDSDREKVINSIKELIDRDYEEEKCLNIRIIGQSGIGKTRTVLEAIEQSSYKNNCLYADSYEAFENFFPEITNMKNINGVLIIDECSEKQYPRLLGDIEYNFPNIKLITIYNASEPDDNGRANILTVGKLDNNSIRGILNEFSINDFIRQDILRYAEGYPRIVVKMAEYAKNNKDCNIIESLNDFWSKYISDYNEKDSSKTEEKISILKHLSLFRRFGYSEHFKEETKFIIDNIKSKCYFSEEAIGNHIKDLKNRNVLRGSSTIYISPRIFQEWLKKEWWKNSEICFNYEEFTVGMPNELKKEFDKELINLKENQKKNIIQSQYKDINDIRLKANLFYILSYNNEIYAFRHLESIINNTDDDSFIVDDVTLNSLVGYFASLPDFFEDASRILFRFGCLERGTAYHNNAKESFSKLFSIFTEGDIRETSASLEQKINFLKELYKDNLDKTKMLIFLDALKVILEDPKMITHNITTSRNISYIITKNFKYEQIPFDYLSEAFDVLIDIASKAVNEEIIRKINNIINEIFYLLYNNETILFGIKCYEKAKDLPSVDIINLVSRFEISFEYNHFNGLSDENISILKKAYSEIKDSHKFNDFKTLCISRYLEQTSDEYKKIIEYIKQGALDNESNIELIFDERCYISLSIGCDIALFDKDNAILDKLWSVYERINQPIRIGAISGYYAGLYKVNPKLAEDLIIKFKDDKFKYKQLPYLIKAVETDKTISLFIDGIKNGDFNITSFNAMGNNCSLLVLESAINYLIGSCNPYAIKGALYLIYRNDDRLNFDYSFKTKCFKNALKAFSSLEKQFNDGYLLSNLINSLITKKHKKEDIIELLELSINVDFSYNDSYYGKIIKKISKLYTDEVWDILKRYLITDTNSFIFKIREYWNNFLSEIISEDRIISWIEESNGKEDKEAKLTVLGEIAPDEFIPDETKGFTFKLYRSLMCKYNSRRLYNQLSYHYHSISYIGSEVDKINKRTKEIENLIKNEKNANILNWLKEQKDSINDRLSKAKAEEERKQ